jgi:hypothetical protein
VTSTRVERAIAFWTRRGPGRARAATRAQFIEALFGRWEEIGLTLPVMRRLVRADLLELGQDVRAGRVERAGRYSG